jgi:hypothetical protein
VGVDDPLIGTLSSPGIRKAQCAWQPALRGHDQRIPGHPIVVRCQRTRIPRLLRLPLVSATAHDHHSETTRCNACCRVEREHCAHGRATRLTIRRVTQNARQCRALPELPSPLQDA